MAEPFKCPACGSNDYTIVLTGCSVSGATLQESFAWNSEAGEYASTGTVILDSTMMQPVIQNGITPTAVTSTPDGVYGQMHVLLADNDILREVSSRNSWQQMASGPGMVPPELQPRARRSRQLDAYDAALQELLRRHRLDRQDRCWQEICYPT